MLCNDALTIDFGVRALRWGGLLTYDGAEAIVRQTGGDGMFTMVLGGGVVERWAWAFRSPA